MFAVCLIRPKYDGNVGGTLRAAENFGAAAVFIAGAPHHRERTDVQKAERRVPLILVEKPEDATLGGAAYVAVERCPEAMPLPEFEHPERAVYVFGPEDSGISKDFRARCAHTVRIPSRGSLNLAACVNLVLYDRTCQLGLPEVFNAPQPATKEDPHVRRVERLRNPPDPEPIGEAVQRASASIAREAAVW